MDMQAEELDSHRFDARLMYLSIFFAGIGVAGVSDEGTLTGIGGLIASAGFYFARGRQKKMRLACIILGIIGIVLIVAEFIAGLIEP